MIFALTSRPPSRQPLAGPALAALLSASLAGCSGGDDDTPVPGNPAEPPLAHVTPPLAEIPPSSYSGRQLEAYSRLNEARLAAGVGALRQNAQLDAAAQAHSLYLTKNFVTGHGEDPAKPYFTGVDSTARARAHGYVEDISTEIISYFLSDENGMTHANAHLNSVYHLYGALEPRANAIGIGLESTTSPGLYFASTFSLGSTDSSSLRPFRDTWVWPAPGIADVIPRFRPTSEIPNPMPDVGSATVGPPIMFCGANGNYAPLAITTIALVANAGGVSPDLRVLHHPETSIEPIAGVDARVDPNIAELYPWSMRNCIFVVPMSELTSDTRYTVDIAGMQGGLAVSKSWSFETTK